VTRPRYADSLRQSRYLPLLLLAIYAGLAIWLLGIKPLWLDEIIQLVDTSNVDFVAMVHTAQNPGESLLPNLLQWLVLRLGHSRELARTPALLFGLTAPVCFWRLARQIGLKYSLAAAVAFALLPINFRYLTEARPYSQGAFFCCWALLLIFQIDQEPSWKRSLLLSLALTGGLYSQPFVLLPLLAVMLATVLSSPDRKRTWRFQLVPLIAAAILYLPWLLVASKTWNGDPAPGNPHAASTVFDARIALRVAHEWTGGGYFAGGLLIVFILLALWAGGMKRIQTILVSGTLGGLLLILLAEDRLHYFFAARQLIFTLPTAVLLAATVLDSESHRTRVTARFCWAALVLISIGSIVAGELRPHENWEVVAKRLVQLGRKGDCVTGVDAGRLPYFEFFQPTLQSRVCGPVQSGKLLLVIDPYSSTQLKANKLAELSRGGWVRRDSEKIGKFEILSFASKQ